MNQNITLLLQQLSNLSHIPIYLIDKTGMSLFDSIPDALHPYIAKEFLENNAAATHSPWMKTIDEVCAFAGFHWDGGMLCLGPVILGQYNHSELWRVANILQVSLDCASTFPHKSLHELTAYLICLFQIFCGKTISQHDIYNVYMKHDFHSVDSNQLSYQEELYRLDKADLNQHYSNYNDVNKFIDMVQNGDIESFNQYIKVLDSYALDAAGNMAENSYKRSEYFAVSLITTVTRAMIQGNINTRKALNMSDLALQKIEKCNTISEIMLCSNQYLRNAIEEVAKEKSKKHSFNYVEKTKEFISRNLRKKIVIKDIADKIAISPEHLSRVFHEQEGITIQQYILKERINAACNMLRYSEYEISIISNYLQFSSQSYFTKVFKQHIGETPKQYRLKNGQYENI